jgi:hypothetical protein
MRRCTRDVLVSRLESSLERNNTPHGTNTRKKQNVPLKLHLTELQLLYFCCDHGAADRIRSPKRRVLRNKQDGVLDDDKTMDNVQKYNICTLGTGPIRTVVGG